MSDKLKEQAYNGQYDFYNRVRAGRVLGHKIYLLTGRKESIDTSELDDLSNLPLTTAVPNPGGVQLRFKSASVNDSGAGSGTRTIVLHYLDIEGNEQNEVKTLNGLTEVDTDATDIDKVQWMHVLTHGVLPTSDGDINLTNIAETITYSCIKAGGNQSLAAIYHIPNKKKGYVLGWKPSGIGKSDVRLRATVNRFNRSLVPNTFIFQDLVMAKDFSGPWVEFKGGLLMPALSTVKISALAFAPATDCGGSFEIMVVDD